MYWKYFLALERDLEMLSRYIEFNQDNWSTYSIELSKLLLSVGSETDVVLKALCKLIDSKSRATNINEYRDIVLGRYSQFPNLRVRVLGTNIELEPWKDWSNSANPKWWGYYNDVKHNRTSEYKSANLKNVLNGFAGLMIAVFYYMHNEGANPDNRVSVDKVSLLFDTENDGTWDRELQRVSYAILP